MTRTIPNIDISEIVINGFNSKKSSKVIKKIEKACLKFGFFTVTGHGIPIVLTNSILNISKNFFNKPQQEKLKIASKKWNNKNSNIYRGYFPSFVNGKEGLDIGDPSLNKTMKKLLSKSKFECLDLKKVFNKREQKIIKQYFDRMFILGEILFNGIIKNFTTDNSILKKAFDRPKTLTTLRFNYYPKQSHPIEISSDDGKKLSCETHVDSGIVTILYHENNNALQVQNRQNKKWHTITYRKNSFVVNTGLALQYFTNNMFKATNHRVIFKNSTRISIPFFFEPNYDFKINPSLLNIKKKTFFKKNIYDVFLSNSLKKFTEYKRK